jgi:hypothetical protein
MLLRKLNPGTKMNSKGEVGGRTKAVDLQTRGCLTSSRPQQPSASLHCCGLDSSTENHQGPFVPGGGAERRGLRRKEQTTKERMNCERGQVSGGEVSGEEVSGEEVNAWVVRPRTVHSFSRISAEMPAQHLSHLSLTLSMSHCFHLLTFDLGSARRLVARNARKIVIYDEQPFSLSFH